MEGYAACEKRDGQFVVVVCCGGAIYDAAPSVQIDAPSGGGRAAAAVAHVENGRVMRVDVTDQGSGYAVDERPGVSFS